MQMRTAGALLALLASLGCDTRAGSFLTTPLASAATLSGIQVSAGTLTPVFDAATLNYTVAVSNTTTQIVVLAGSPSPTATITVNGTPISNGGESPPIPLTVGANTIPVVVRAQSGNSRTYTITVNRAAP